MGRRGSSVVFRTYDELPISTEPLIIGWIPRPWREVSEPGPGVFWYRLQFSRHRFVCAIGRNVFRWFFSWR